MVDEPVEGLPEETGEEPAEDPFAQFEADLASGPGIDPDAFDDATAPPSDRPTIGDPGASPFGPFDLSAFGLGGFDLTELLSVLQTPGPLNWEVARQVARAMLTQTGSDTPVSADAIRELTDLARAALGLVAESTGLATVLGLPVRAVTRTEWADLHLDALRPVLDALAESLGAAMRGGEAAAAADPLAGMAPMLAPIMLGVQAGTMIGFLADHALGRYDLPLPSADEPTLCFVVSKIDEFGSEWRLPAADLRFYLALHEAVRAAQRSRPWVRERLVDLATEYVGGYEVDADALTSLVGDVDPTDPELLQNLAGRPNELLGALQTERQRVTLAELRRFTTILEGYADTVLDHIGRRMIPTTFDQIHEAVQRHRVERGEAGTFIESLLGIDLQRADYETGRAFCAGVVERTGIDGLNRLWSEPGMLPTPAELDAPGLWLARIDLAADR